MPVSVSFNPVLFLFRVSTSWTQIITGKNRDPPKLINNHSHKSLFFSVDMEDCTGADDCKQNLL